VWSSEGYGVERRAEIGEEGREEILRLRDVVASRSGVLFKQ
jgi:hypothetical protein